MSNLSLLNAVFRAAQDIAFSRHTKNGLRRSFEAIFTASDDEAMKTGHNLIISHLVSWKVRNDFPHNLQAIVYAMFFLKTCHMMFMVMYSGMKTLP